MEPIKWMPGEYFSTDKFGRIAYQILETSDPDNFSICSYPSAIPIANYGRNSIDNNFRVSQENLETTQGWYHFPTLESLEAGRKIYEIEQEEFKKGRFTVKIGKAHSHYIEKISTQLITSPTGNCQVSCFSAYQNLFPDDVNMRLKALKCFMAQIGISKQVLIDIKEQNKYMVTQVFPKDSIVFEQPYESTNGSQMIMFLLKTDFLKN